MSSSPVETLLKDVKALFEFARRPIVWIPGLLVPLTVTAVWAYLSHPEWLEATAARSARTGKAVTVDPNSPVTRADLDLDRLSAVAETGDLSVLVNQVPINGSLPTPPDRQVQPSGEGQRSSNSGSPQQANSQADNPFTPAVLELQKQLSHKNQNPSNSAVESPLQQALDRFGGAEIVSTQPQVQTPNSGTQASGLPRRNLSGQSPLRSSRSLPFSYPIQPGVGGYSLPAPGTSQAGTAVSGSIASQGTASNSVVLPRGTSLEQRGNSRWQQTPYGLTPIRPRGGNLEVTDAPVNCAYLRSRGSTGCTPANNLNTPNTTARSQQPFNNQTFLNNNGTVNSPLNSQPSSNPAFPNNNPINAPGTRQVGVPNRPNSNFP